MVLVVYALWLKYYFYAWEGWHGPFMGYVYQLVTATSYAPGYSDFRFRKIRVGMCEDEVLDLVGEPIARTDMDKRHQEICEKFEIENKRVPTGMFRWEYACAGDDYDYRIRDVFFVNEKVVKVVYSYYFD